MPISAAVERGSVIYVYNEKGMLITSFPGSTAPGDGLQGYTSSTVSIKRSGVIYIYNEKGMLVSSVPAS